MWPKHAQIGPNWPKVEKQVERTHLLVDQTCFYRMVACGCVSIYVHRPVEYEHVGNEHAIKKKTN